MSHITLMVHAHEGEGRPVGIHEGRRERCKKTKYLGGQRLRFCKLGVFAVHTNVISPSTMEGGGKRQSGLPGSGVLRDDGLRLHSSGSVSLDK
jgi:hypothetical protein